MVLVPGTIHGWMDRVETRIELSSVECFRDPSLPMAIGPTRSDKRAKLDGQQSFALPGLWASGSRLSGS